MVSNVVMVLSEADTRTWAAKCASNEYTSRAEQRAWQAIAERGRSFDIACNKNKRPYRGGSMMSPGLCFGNAALTVAGYTKFDPDGCKYAEGFAQGVKGLWFHHAWVVTANHLVIERTWKDVATAYVGVIVTHLVRDIGCCQLSPYPLGISFGPAAAPEWPGGEQ